MCNFASLVVTKDRVLWSKRTDGHTEICEEYGLHEDGARGPNVVKVELLPPNGEWWKPRSEWRFHVDQDSLPEWWEAGEGEARARVALEDLAAVRIFDGRDGEIVGISAMVRNATVHAGGNATVDAGDNATVHAGDNATVHAGDNATVHAGDNATVEARDNATVIGYAPARHKLSDLAVLVDRSQAGKVKMEIAEKGAK
jgi:hypothetical protein